MKLIAYSDGASRGNPGAAAVGLHILDEDGGEIFAEGRCIGETTNNVAEYRGAIMVLTEAKRLGARDVQLYLDSELVVKQIHGQYRVKQPALIELKKKLDALIAGFDSFRVAHVRREQNAVADRLANEALDAAGAA